MIVYDSYLAHHGILGQKWGVRRYQNKDGTLTAAGKDRYNHLVKSDEEAGRQHKKDTKWIKTDPSKQTSGKPKRASEKEVLDYVLNKHAKTPYTRHLTQDLYQKGKYPRLLEIFANMISPGAGYGMYMTQLPESPV